MAHKEVYRITSSLNRSFLDLEIPLGGKDWSLRPVPMKVIMFFAGATLGLIWLVRSTPLGSGAWWATGLFVVWWIIAAVYFGRTAKTKEMKFRQVGSALRYMPKSARRVLTRRSSQPMPFAGLVGIESIDKHGLIKFWDGTLGQAYLVVGSASLMLFEEDRHAILDRVEAFWRKITPDAEWIVMSTKEPQRVHHQIAALERRNRALRADGMFDPDLFELMSEQYDILDQFVGKSFKSIHQYMILKGDDLESLRRAHANLQDEVSSSALMIRACSMLDRKGVLDMLGVFYQGRR